MITFYPKWLADDASTALLNQTRAYPFERRRLKVFDRWFDAPRETIYFSEDGQGYEYSGQTTEAHPYPADLIPIKTQLETFVSVNLQACLVNWYKNGKDCVGFHTDSDHIFGQKPTIVSLTVGAARRFKIRPKGQKNLVQTFDLGHGDVLVLTDEAVLNYEHSIPKTAKPVGERINFTFRSKD